MSAKKVIEAGDEIFTFLGEELCQARMTMRYDDLRIGAQEGDNTYCVFEKFCYPTKKEAVQAMQRFLVNNFQEDFC